MATGLGAFLNAVGILLGAVIGLARGKALSVKTQLFFRNAIGVFNLFLGLRLIYENAGGTFSYCFKEMLAGLLAIVFGFWAGKLLRLQKVSNYLGRSATKAIVAAQKPGSGKSMDGFNACAVMFCAEPLGIVGAVTDGLSGYFYLLLLKGVMDALAMADLVRVFRWPSALSALPVFVFLSAITMAVQMFVKSSLTAPELGAVNVAAGLMTCIVTVVIFEVRKVELANYLPALVIAPLLARFIH